MSTYTIGEHGKKRPEKGKVVFGKVPGSTPLSTAERTSVVPKKIIGTAKKITPGKSVRHGVTLW